MIGGIDDVVAAYLTRDDSQAPAFNMPQPGLQQAAPKPLVLGPSTSGFPSTILEEGEREAEAEFLVFALCPVLCRCSVVPCLFALVLGTCLGHWTWINGICLWTWSPCLPNKISTYRTYRG
ncbi:hypothetical protein Salmi_Mp064 (mitochondrion) [Salvia miltiorrhiza]|uniref:Uncharacterized protein n=1 Tax=Salvia miltiorrhiza TaxID=226208 RepID=V9P5B1_SALMI|nr:hypothetical protein Salmi_Mp064 [Salvia miltiorrhiza]AGU16593.1 hypothetical protein Salmi_Mp064 [Salvia miltiorrhiza]